ETVELYHSFRIESHALTGGVAAKNNVSHKVIVAALDCLAFRHFGDERQGILRLELQSFPYLVAVEDWDVVVIPVVDGNRSSHGKHGVNSFHFLLISIGRRESVSQDDCPEYPSVRILPSIIAGLHLLHLCF